LPGDDKEIAKSFVTEILKTQRKNCKSYSIKSRVEKATADSADEAMVEFKKFHELPEKNTRRN
jgi:hypothetical protein